MIRSSGRTAWLVESTLVCVVFAVAAWVGGRFVTASRAAGHRPAFYQQYFEPAVMMACGRGFAVATPAPAPALQRFLNQEVDTFSCDAIPPGQRVNTEGLFQRAWYYLMLLVAVGWTLNGISWSGLTPVYGALFGAAVALAYGIFRCGMGRALAVLCVLALTVSTLHLANLPHLRDYAKAPFVLAHVLILARLVWRPLRRWQLVALAAAFGAVLGIGYGFRTDLLADIPPFLAVVLAFLPGGMTRNLRLKAAMIVICAAVFAGMALPALQQVLVRGGCQFHVVLLGLDADFNEDLGVESSFYQWNASYSDELIATAVSSYHDRMHAPAPLEYCSHDYDVASGAYLRDIALRVPGDIVTRAYASALRVLDLPFPWYDAPLPNVAPAIYRPRSALLKAMAGTARLASFAAILLLGASSIRLGLFALLFVIYFGGLPALQFANRHYFHLEFIGWWAMAFVFLQGVRAIRPGTPGSAPRTRAEWSAFGRQAARFAVIAGLTITVPLIVLRVYQQPRLDQLTRVLLAAPRIEVPMEPTADGSGLRLPGGAIEGLDYDPMRTAYLDIHVDLAACPAGVPLAMRYDPAHPAYNFSWPLRIMPKGTVSERVLLPVYRYFEGIDAGAGGARCLSRIERLAFVRKLPLLPVLTLPPGWRTLPFHQRLIPVALLPALWTR